MGYQREKKEEVSFFHSVIHEGFYPFRNKKHWSTEEKDLPSTFSPRLEHLLVSSEFEKFGFSEEEEKEILREHFSGDKAEKKTDEREFSTTC